MSTAYVAGMRRGPAPEALLSETPFAAKVAWRDEVDAARRARSDAEAASRDPKQLARLRAAARAELGAAGIPLLAERTEKLRADWAKDHMVQLGKARAQALGWPDAYAFSKALGEWALHRGPRRPAGDGRAAFDHRGGPGAALPGLDPGLPDGRPDHHQLCPGLAEGVPRHPRGGHRRHPRRPRRGGHPGRGRPAARWPSPTWSTPRPVPATRCATASWSTLCHDWFSEHPLADDKGQPIVVPEWSFPGRRRVQNQLRQATRVLQGAERALQALPLRGSQADLAARIEERRDEAERALSYVELYGAYTETEAIFSVDRLLELSAGLAPDEQRRVLPRPRRHRLAPVLSGHLRPGRRRSRPGPPG